MVSLLQGAYKTNLHCIMNLLFVCVLHCFQQYFSCIAVVSEYASQFCWFKSRPSFIFTVAAVFDTSRNDPFISIYFKFHFKDTVILH